MALKMSMAPASPAVDAMETEKKAELANTGNETADSMELGSEGVDAGPVVREEPQAPEAPEEPEDDADKGLVSNLAIRLPNGDRLRRRFFRHNTVHVRLPAMP
jgi:hypothetical protein